MAAMPAEQVSPESVNIAISLQSQAQRKTGPRSRYFFLTFFGGSIVPGAIAPRNWLRAVAPAIR